MRVGVFGAGGAHGLDGVAEQSPTTPTSSWLRPSTHDWPASDINQVAGGAGSSVQVEGDAQALLRAEAQVAVDFTDVAAARQEDLRWCATNGVHAVVGTTGFTRDDVTELAREFSGSSNCVLAANFAIGAALIDAFCRSWAAPYVDTAEIVELLSSTQVGRPSGTSLRIAGGMSKSREVSGSGGWGRIRRRLRW